MLDLNKLIPAFLGYFAALSFFAMRCKFHIDQFDRLGADNPRCQFAYTDMMALVLASGWLIISWFFLHIKPYSIIRTGGVDLLPMQAKQPLVIGNGWRFVRFILFLAQAALFSALLPTAIRRERMLGAYRAQLAILTTAIVSNLYALILLCKLMHQGRSLGVYGVQVDYVAVVIEHGFVSFVTATLFVTILILGWKLWNPQRKEQRKDA